MIFLMLSSVARLNIINEEEHFPLGTVPSEDEGNVLLILFILSTKNVEKEFASYCDVNLSVISI